MSASHFSSSHASTAGHVFPLLYNVMYCSQATTGVVDEGLARIIETSHRWNPAQGITGLLVFSSSVFFQWLESPRSNVMQLMTNLTKDPRHEDLVILSAVEEVRERLFPNWDMELVSGADIRDVLVDALEYAKNAAALELLLVQLDAGELGSVRQS